MPAVYLCHELTVDSHAGAAVIVQPVAVTALLVGVQVDAPALGGGSPHQVKAGVQLPQLQSMQAGRTADAVAFSFSTAGGVHAETK